MLSLSPDPYIFYISDPYISIFSIFLVAADGYYGGSSPGYNWGSFVSGFENFAGIQIVPNWIKP